MHVHVIAVFMLLACLPLSVAVNQLVLYVKSASTQHSDWNDDMYIRATVGGVSKQTDFQWGVPNPTWDTFLFFDTSRDRVSLTLDVMDEDRVGGVRTLHTASVLVTTSGENKRSISWSSNGGGTLYYEVFFLYQTAGGSCSPYRGYTVDCHSLLECLGGGSNSFCCFSSYNCKACSSESGGKCTSCESDRYLSASGSCLQKLPTGSNTTCDANQQCESGMCSRYCCNSRSNCAGDCASSGECTACVAEHFLQKGSCLPWSSCDTATEFQASLPTATSDRVCKPISPCQSDEWQQQPATPTSDRVCEAVRAPCDTSVEYRHQPPTPTSNRVCKPITQCEDGEFEAVPPTPTSDRVCNPLTACKPVIEYEVLAPTATSNRQCLETTLCDFPEEFELHPPTDTTDRACSGATTCEALQVQVADVTPSSDRVCQCSTTCTNTMLSNDRCDEGCNSASCAYDDGMCLTQFTTNLLVATMLIKQGMSQTAFDQVETACFSNFSQPTAPHDARNLVAEAQELATVQSRACEIMFNALRAINFEAKDDQQIDGTSTWQDLRSRLQSKLVTLQQLEEKRDRMAELIQQYDMVEQRDAEVSHLFITFSSAILDAIEDMLSDSSSELKSFFTSELAQQIDAMGYQVGPQLAVVAADVREYMGETLPDLDEKVSAIADSVDTTRQESLQQFQELQRSSIELLFQLGESGHEVAALANAVDDSFHQLRFRVSAVEYFASHIQNVLEEQPTFDDTDSLMRAVMDDYSSKAPNNTLEGNGLVAFAADALVPTDSFVGKVLATLYTGENLVDAPFIHINTTLSAFTRHMGASAGAYLQLKYDTYMFALENAPTPADVQEPQRMEDGYLPLLFVFDALIDLERSSSVYVHLWREFKRTVGWVSVAMPPLSTAQLLTAEITDLNSDTLRAVMGTAATTVSSFQTTLRAVLERNTAVRSVGQSAVQAATLKSQTDPEGLFGNVDRAEEPRPCITYGQQFLTGSSALQTVLLDKRDKIARCLNPTVALGVSVGTATPQNLSSTATLIPAPGFADAVPEWKVTMLKARVKTTVTLPMAALNVIRATLSTAALVQHATDTATKVIQPRVPHRRRSTLEEESLFRQAVADSVRVDRAVHAASALANVMSGMNDTLFADGDAVAALVHASHDLDLTELNARYSDRLNELLQGRVSPHVLDLLQSHASVAISWQQRLSVLANMFTEAGTQSVLTERAGQCFIAGNCGSGKTMNRAVIAQKYFAMQHASTSLEVLDLFSTVQKTFRFQFLQQGLPSIELSASGNGFLESKDFETALDALDLIVQQFSETATGKHRNAGVVRVDLTRGDFPYLFDALLANGTTSVALYPPKNTVYRNVQFSEAYGYTLPSPAGVAEQDEAHVDLQHGALSTFVVGANESLSFLHPAVAEGRVYSTQYRQDTCLPLSSQQADDDMLLMSPYGVWTVHVNQGALHTGINLLSLFLHVEYVKVPLSELSDGKAEMFEIGPCEDDSCSRFLPVAPGLVPSPELVECVPQIICNPGFELVAGACSPCPSQTFSSDNLGRCRRVSECGVGQFEFEAPTATSNRICDSLQQCSLLQYQAAPPTPTSDRNCSVLTQCNAGFFEHVEPTPTSDRVCCNPASDQASPKCQTCPAGTFAMSDPAWPFTKCTAITTCNQGEFEAVAPTLTSDRVCEAECVPGTFLSTNGCETCPSGTFSTDFMASDCTTCSLCTGNVRKECTLTSDTECTPSQDATTTDKGGLSTPAVIGIACGVVLLIVVLVVVLRRRSKSKAAQLPHVSHFENPSYDDAYHNPTFRDPEPPMPPRPPTPPKPPMPPASNPIYDVIPVQVHGMGADSEV
eukprot:m.243240 g.243240  ORF g.243240 m.243240 type:complete len:1831 (-) comp15341_c0_seq3:1668-7160(-)